MTKGLYKRAPKILEKSASHVVSDSGNVNQITNLERWFSRGVKPFLVNDIVKQNGAKHASNIYGMLHSGRIFSERVGTKIILYPTTTNVFELYGERTNDYMRTLSEIKKDRFNLIAKQPFKAYDIGTIITEPETYNLESDVKRILEGGKVYIISSKPSGSDFFIVAEEYAQWFVPRYNNGTLEERAQRIESFKARIREHYSKFENWMPHSK